MDGEISPEEVESLLARDGDGLRIVDVRTAAAFGRSHIPGSENVPFDRLPDRVASFEGAERIVTVCPHGKASQQAARLIASYEGTGDARVESMAGGLEAWDGELRSAETDSDERGSDPGADAPF